MYIFFSKKSSKIPNFLPYLKSPLVVAGLKMLIEFSHLKNYGDHRKKIRITYKEWRNMKVVSYTF